MSKLSENIAYYRKEKGLSQEKLADYLGISRQAVTKWENDTSKPSSENLIQLTEVLEISMDTLLGNEELTNNSKEIVVGKVPSLYIGLAALCIVIYLIASILLDRFNVGTVICLFILFVPIQTFIHLFFSNAIKYDSFEGIAGYSNKVKYNTNELKKLLVKIDLQLGMSTTVYIFIMALFNFLNPTSEWLNGILIVTYVFEFTAIILINNYKMMDKLFRNKEDYIKAKRGFPITILYIFLILIGTLITILSFTVHEIPNNSLHGLLVSGLLILGITFATVAYLLQNKAIEENKKYSKTSIVCFIICIISYVLMLFV